METIFILFKHLRNCKFAIIEHILFVFHLQSHLLFILYAFIKEQDKRFVSRLENNGIVQKRL